MDFDINALFNEQDSDNDGRITIDQTFNLLKKVNINIYKGSVSKVILPRLNFFPSGSTTDELRSRR